VEPIVVLVALAVGASLLPLLVTRHSVRALERDWGTALATVGIHDVAATGVVGAACGRVRIELTSDGARMRPGTRVVVKGLPTDLEMVPRRTSRLARAFDTRSLPIGDDAFDDAIAVYAEPLLAHALLDCETRQALVALVRDVEDARVSGGQLVMTSGFEPIATRAARLGALLCAALSVCERLIPSGALEALVAGNLTTEPHVETRRRALAVLLSERPEDPATRAAVGHALDDADESVRLAAALASGAEGHAVLRAIASDVSSPEESAVRALAKLGASLNGGQVAQVLEGALAADREKVVMACLQSPALATMPDAERLLIGLLAHPASTVCYASAAALGRVGTVAAVVALRAAESEDRIRGATVREAVASIQSRLIGADRGQLAVAPDAGELSLADGTDGQVSLARDERDA
jgi:hypothetical protein